MSLRPAHPTLFLSCITALALFTAAAAQTGTGAHKASPKEIPPSAFKLVSVKATGSQRYTPDEIIAATGLELGQTVSDDDFKHASRHLGESGVFSNVGYSFQYSPAGTKLELQVTDAQKSLPARFDNVVWFSDQELLEKLRALVPLFRGQLPEAGDLPDQVSDALQALLIQRKVEGHAEYLRSGPENGPITAFDFRVAGPNLRIRNAGFSGAGSAELPSLQAAAKELQGQEYLRSILRVQAEMNFLPVFLARGYLKAAFSEAQAQVAAEDPQTTTVDVTFPVDPGRQYRLTQVQWSGNTVFSVEKLQPLVDLPPGQPANAVRLGEDIQTVKKLYGTRGYMAVAIETLPQMDDSQSTVSYQLQIHEGDVYRMGALEIQGLDSRTTDRLIEEWAIRGGDPYDSSYLPRFLKGPVEKLMPSGEWKITSHESLDAKDKTVEVTLRFDPRPR